MFDYCVLVCNTIYRAKQVRDSAMYTQAQIADHKANARFECCKSKSSECFEACQYLKNWMNAPTSLPSEPTWFKPKP